MCDDGIGLYIGTDTGQRHDTLFRRSGSTYEIDLTLFQHLDLLLYAPDIFLQ